MSEETVAPQDTAQLTKIAVIAIIAVIALTGITIAAYQYAKSKASGTVVLPGGVTYLGPTNEQKTPTAPLRFTVEASTPWIEFQGKTYPYSFSHPETLSLVVFPNDPTDAVAISWGNIPPQQNIMMNIDLLQQNETMKEYINKPKIEYVRNWWRQFSGLKGSSDVIEFTNSKGMKGYRTKFINHADQSPNDDVFFEIPRRTNMMVRFANGSLDPAIFDRIIDTFSWDATQPTRAPATPAPTN